MLVQNERLFADRVREAGQIRGPAPAVRRVPPQTYAAPAPYGAGHCNFTAAQRVAAVGVLDAWVRTARRPDAARLADLLYDVTGVTSRLCPSRVAFVTIS